MFQEEVISLDKRHEHMDLVTAVENKEAKTVAKAIFWNGFAFWHRFTTNLRDIVRMIGIFHPINTLAYYEHSYITVITGFITLAPRHSVIKILIVIYECD